MTDPDPTREDLRQATLLAIGQSSTLTTVALALVAGEVALATFLIDKYELGAVAWLLGALSFTAFLASAYQGGRGTRNLIAAGARGDWKTSTKRGRFFLQIVYGIAGAITLVATLGIGLSSDRRDSSVDEVRKALRTAEAALKTHVANESVRLETVDRALERERRSVQRLARRVRRLER